MRYKWGELNTQQVGAYAEYFVKMELTMYGFQVYGTEVDDRGIDFIARFQNERFLTIQVKSIRGYNYVFMRKDKFQISQDTILALVFLFENHAPELYLIPSTVWEHKSSLFVDRHYEGKKSKAEWGINISEKNIPRLEPYKFENMVGKLKAI